MLLTQETSKSPPCSKVANKNLEYDQIREVKNLKKKEEKTIMVKVSS